MSIDYVILFGTSISHDDDLAEALKRVRKAVYLFTSTHDHMLGTTMPLSGTADRKYLDAGAGIRGFILPKRATDETPRLYAERLVTIGASGRSERPVRDLQVRPVVGGTN